MPWSGSYVGDELTSVATINEIRAALKERQNVTGGSLFTYSAGPPPAPATTAVGTDVQAATFWAALQAEVEGLAGGPAIGQFIRPDCVIDGTLSAPPHSSVGHAIGMFFESTKTLFDLAGKAGWMRKRPREIVGLADAADTQGNVAAVGHRARRVYQPAHAPLWEVYEFNGTAWVALGDPDAEPDLLIGEAGEERSISTIFDTVDSWGRPSAPGERVRGPGGLCYVYGDYGEGTKWYVTTETETIRPDQRPTGYGCIVGRCQEGDYLGAWILEDLRDVIRAVGNRTASHAYGGRQRSSNGATVNASSLGAAKAGADAAWATQSDSGTSSPTTGASTNLHGYAYASQVAPNSGGAPGTPHTYSAQGHKRTELLGAVSHGYGARTASLAAYFTGNVTPSSFIGVQIEGQGASIPSTPSTDAYYTIASGLSMANGVTASGTVWAPFPDAATPPPNTPTLPPIELVGGEWKSGAMRGFVLKNVFAVVEWEFAHP